MFKEKLVFKSESLLVIAGIIYILGSFPFSFKTQQVPVQAQMKPNINKDINIKINKNEPYNYKLIKKYFPKEQWQNAWNVSGKENGSRNPDVVNVNYHRKGLLIRGKVYFRTHDVGNFQVNSEIHGHSIADLKNPEFNTKVASKIWQRGGWWHWMVYRRGLVKIK